MTQPINETKRFLLSITKNCETLIKQTHAKTEEILEITLTKPTKTFFSNHQSQLKEVWMIGLTRLEVYNSILILPEENNNFELHNFPDSNSGCISYEKVRDEIERDLEITDITATDLRDEIIGPIITEG